MLLFLVHLQLCLQYMSLSKEKKIFFLRLFKGVLLLSWEIDLGATWSERMPRCHNVPWSVVPKAVVKSSRLQCFVGMDCIIHSYQRPVLGLLLSQTLLQTFRHCLFLKSTMNTEKPVS